MRSDKKKGDLPFHLCRQQGEGSTGRVSKGSAIIYNARVEDIGGDDVLEMLYQLYRPIPVLQFGVEY